MVSAQWLCLLLAFQSAAVVSPGVPPQLRGDWTVTRLIPTTTISCWDKREAKRLLGTTVHYSSDALGWKNYGVAHAVVSTQSLTAFQFRVDYSGGGAADSEIDFNQLGIRVPSATIVKIQHKDANITGGTAEIPGDWVFLKDRDTIILSVCNLYFEAHRSHKRASSAPR